MAYFRKTINIVILVVILNNLACEKQTDTSSHTYDDLYRGRKYFEVKIDQAALFESAHRSILIDFTDMTPEKVEYRWRVFDMKLTNVVVGAGQARTRMVLLRTGDDHSIGVDLGSDRLLQVGETYILWQPNSDKSAWLFYNLATTTIKIIPDTDFENYNFLDFETRDNVNAKLRCFSQVHTHSDRQAGRSGVMCY